MISRFSIRNFKRFASLDIDGMGPVTVIAGKNGVGKSTLLEAVFLLHDFSNPVGLFRHWGFRGYREKSVDIQSFLGAAFHLWDLQQPIVLGATQAEDEYRLEYRTIPDVGRRRIQLVTDPELGRQTQNTGAVPLLEISLQKNGGSLRSGRLSIGGGDASVSLGENGASPFPSAVYLSSGAGLSAKELAERFSTVDVEGDGARHVIEVLRIMHPQLKDIDLQWVGETAVLHADVGMGRKIPINLLGDGTFRLLSFLLSMSYARGGVVLVDEIDNGFHWSAMPHVWRALREAASRYDCQIIATTHSRECLVAARETFASLTQPEFHYIRLAAENGGVAAKPFTFDQFMAAIDEEWEIR